jgi:hypothetical protein
MGVQEFPQPLTLRVGITEAQFALQVFLPQARVAVLQVWRLVAPQFNMQGPSSLQWKVVLAVQDDFPLQLTLQA